MCNYYISVGINSTSSGRISDMKGISTYYISTNPKSKALAISCLDSLISETNGANRGIIPGDNNRLMEATNNTSVMVKLGFATNGEERELLTHEDYQDKLARGIANGILNSIKGE
jgi:N-acetylmuramoyl-L-alanine amidase